MRLIWLMLLGLSWGAGLQAQSSSRFIREWKQPHLTVSFIHPVKLKGEGKAPALPHDFTLLDYATQPDSAVFRFTLRLRQEVRRLEQVEALDGAVPLFSFTAPQVLFRDRHKGRWRLRGEAFLTPAQLQTLMLASPALRLRIRTDAGSHRFRPTRKWRKQMALAASLLFP